MAELFLVEHIAKFTQNIHVYQVKYLNKRNLNKEKHFQSLKSDFPTYKLYKIFMFLTDFSKVVTIFQKLRKVVSKFYELCKVFSHFC